MKKSTVNYFVSRIYKAARDPDLTIMVKKMKGLRGLTIYKSVALNPCEPMLRTFIHEMLHVIYPLWSETKVLEHESKIINQLSACQVRRLLGLLVQLLELNKDVKKHEI